MTIGILYLDKNNNLLYWDGLYGIYVEDFEYLNELL